MLKNWKSLFVKAEEENSAAKETFEPLSFPLNTSPAQSVSGNNEPARHVRAQDDPAIREVLEIYESGLDSINMPGYDFYEFYKAIESTGNNSDQAYKMAFHMARTLDKTISAGKLLNDADFYISKINEVHSEYVRQGQHKLNAIQDRKQQEKGQLGNEIDAATNRITQLRNELAQLETEISQKRSLLAKIDGNHLPQEKAVKDKLMANDHAHTISIQRLNIVKQCIQQYIKD